MKKQERNCGMTPYPIYSGMPNMMGGIAPIQGPMMQGYMYNDPIYTTSMDTNTSYDNLQNQINMLDKRITKLEANMNNGTSYNSFSETNYHVM